MLPYEPTFGLLVPVADVVVLRRVAGRVAGVVGVRVRGRRLQGRGAHS
jgi:hypothetical protein